MSKTYVVEAKRWEHGWELHVEGVGVTQSKSLGTAARMAREYISLVETISDESTIDVEIRAQIDAPLSEQVMVAPDSARRDSFLAAASASISKTAEASAVVTKRRPPTRIRASSDLPAVLMPVFPIVAPNTQPGNELLDRPRHSVSIR